MVKLEKIKIRLADNLDLEDIVKIDHNSFVDNKATKDKMKDRIFQKEIAVAVYETKIVGCMIFKILKNKKCEIFKVSVKPEFRRNGIGSLMVKWIVNKAVDLGSNKLIYRVRKDNKKSLKMFKKRGVKPTKLIKSFYKDGTDAYEFEENIN